MTMDIKFLRGLAASLPETRDDKTFYYTTDTHELYLGNYLLSNEVTADQYSSLEERVKALEDWKVIIDEWKNGLPAYVEDSVYQAHLTTQDARDDGQDELIAALREDLDEITEVGGEPNKVDDVTVDGVSVLDGKVAKIDLSGKENVGVAAGLVDGAKTELQGKIDLKADKTEIADMATKTFVAGAYEPIGAEDRAKSYVDGKFTDANLAQYTTEQEVKDIVDGVISAAADVETTLTGLTELVDYIEKHGGDASAMATDIGVLKGKVEVIEGKPAYSISSGDVSNWNGEIGAKVLAQGVKDVVDGNKATWDKAATALQAADIANKVDRSELDAYWKEEDQLTFVQQNNVLQSGITKEKVAGYDATKKTVDDNAAIWSGKQDALSESQLAAVNSGITAGKVQSYDEIVASIGDYAKSADVEATYLKIADKYDDTAVKGRLDVIEAKPAMGISAEDISLWNAEKGANAAVVALEQKHDGEMVVINNNFTAIANQLSWGSF